MSDAYKGFWRYLQTLPDPAKKRIIIVTTAIVMVFVIYLWLAYFNNIITGISQPAALPVAQNPPAANAPATPAVPRASIGQQFRGGLGSIYSGFMGIVHGVEGIFGAPGQYNIQPTQ